ncbi:LuxR C-terminal-related transcriptional regulator [Streptomyces niveiscabiei]|uniref:helix-turn-helix transcriptional regulator n=1 Tax=Streptomyces niveiscabiei TaxID=164115 RepID=UPI0029A216CF|nr:LuxR C-terminal-related transcriptional regulator [Streptomyces niveiscabiei]MDX3382325.1 LuxR C-terminal-related transcriptional regulator [Streptomyces niveiscabiei]
MTTLGRDPKSLDLPWPFTGREEELALIRQALTAARPGMILTGPAGHGRTRLAAEAVKDLEPGGGRSRGARGRAGRGGFTGARGAGARGARGRATAAAGAHGRGIAATAAGGERREAWGGVFRGDAEGPEGAADALRGGPAGGARPRVHTPTAKNHPYARVSGTPETRHLPFAAFAHLLPEDVTLHRAVELLAPVSLLLVDDAHLLDDASAALVHQLAVQGRTRLLVVTQDGAPAPTPITRLWADELLPRLVLGPLPYDATVQLLTSGAGVPLDALTVDRLDRLARGDLRLLRDLVDAVREQELLVPSGDDTYAWRGPLPLTPAVRERASGILARTDAERETLDRLAFAEPLPVRAEKLDLAVLERLEAEGLIEVGDDTAASRAAESGGHPAVRLADPLHGPVLRAAAGRLRALRLAGEREPYEVALAEESAELVRRIGAADVRDTRAPVGEWLVAEGEPVPPVHACVRARFARLRGDLRQAASWAREGLRHSPADADCRTELARAEEGGVRLDEMAADDGVFAHYARALAQGDATALDEVAGELEERGFLLYAAEARTRAGHAHRDPRAARAARTRAVALTRRCRPSGTPAPTGLALDDLTARQRQIVTLAAAGLSNRQIAERLTLSIRTVGNHLYSAYTRLGASDRGALPWVVGQPA